MPTVRKYAAAAAAELIPARHPSAADPCKDYLIRRRDEGARDARALAAEIAQLGYQGSDQQVRRYLRPPRDLPGNAPPPPPPLPAARDIARRISTSPANLTAEDAAAPDAVTAKIPRIAVITGLARSFADITAGLTATLISPATGKETLGCRPPEQPPPARSPPSPPASARTTTPSATACPCPGTAAKSKEPSASSRKSSARSADVPASPSSASSSSPPASKSNHPEICDRTRKIAASVADDYRVPETYRADRGRISPGPRTITASRRLVRVMARRSSVQRQLSMTRRKGSPEAREKPPRDGAVVAGGRRARATGAHDGRATGGIDSGRREVILIGNKASKSGHCRYG